MFFAYSNPPVVLSRCGKKVCRVVCFLYVFMIFESCKFGRYFQVLETFQHGKKRSWHHDTQIPQLLTGWTGSVVMYRGRISSVRLNVACAQTFEPCLYTTQLRVFSGSACSSDKICMPLIRSFVKMTIKRRTKLKADLKNFEVILQNIHLL